MRVRSQQRRLGRRHRLSRSGEPDHHRVHVPLQLRHRRTRLRRRCLRGLLLEPEARRLHDRQQLRPLRRRPGQLLRFADRPDAMHLVRQRRRLQRRRPVLLRIGSEHRVHVDRRPRRHGHRRHGRLQPDPLQFEPLREFAGQLDRPDLRPGGSTGQPLHRPPVLLRVPRPDPRLLAGGDVAVLTGGQRPRPDRRLARGMRLYGDLPDQFRRRLAGRSCGAELVGHHDRRNIRNSNSPGSKSTVRRSGTSPTPRTSPDASSPRICRLSRIRISPTVSSSS